jgi:hypothetical protein
MRLPPQKCGGTALPFKTPRGAALKSDLTSIIFLFFQTGRREALFGR